MQFLTPPRGESRSICNPEQIASMSAWQVPYRGSMTGATRKSAERRLTVPRAAGRFNIAVNVYPSSGPAAPSG